MRTASIETDIRYRTVGGGPKVVLLHGGMQTARNFTKLAAALASTFTVYVPDRRGRGFSGPVGDDYDLRTEIDDLRAVLDRTGAGNVFGLSSGAVIALTAALELPQIERLAIYEPPIWFDGANPIGWRPRYEKELAAGRTAAAFVTTIKGTADSSALRFVPRAALIPLVKLGIRADGRRNRTPGHTPLGTLIPTMRQDATVVEQAAGPLTRFAQVEAETLLMGGERSAPYLKAVLNGLEPILRRVRRVTLTGVGHLAADDRGRPELVAAELRKFFR